VYEFGQGSGWLGQTNRDAVGQNNFDSRESRVNEVDGNECCFACLIGGRSILLLVFLEPAMKGAGRATDFLGDLGDRCMRIENAVEGVLSSFGTVTSTGHGKSGIKSTRRSD